MSLDVQTPHFFINTVDPPQKQDVNTTDELSVVTESVSAVHQENGAEFARQTATSQSKNKAALSRDLNKRSDKGLYRISTCTGDYSETISINKQNSSSSHSSSAGNENIHQNSRSEANIANVNNGSYRFLIPAEDIFSRCGSPGCDSFDEKLFFYMAMHDMSHQDMKKSPLLQQRSYPGWSLAVLRDFINPEDNKVYKKTCENLPATASRSGCSKSGEKLNTLLEKYGDSALKSFYLSYGENCLATRYYHNSSIDANSDEAIYFNELHAGFSDLIDICIREMTSEKKTMLCKEIYAFIFQTICSIFSMPYSSVLLVREDSTPYSAGGSAVSSAVTAPREAGNNNQSDGIYSPAADSNTDSRYCHTDNLSGTRLLSTEHALSGLKTQLLPIILSDKPSEIKAQQAVRCVSGFFHISQSDEESSPQPGPSSAQNAASGDIYSKKGSTQADISMTEDFEVTSGFDGLTQQQVALAGSQSGSEARSSSTLVGALQSVQSDNSTEEATTRGSYATNTVVYNRARRTAHFDLNVVRKNQEAISRSSILAEQGSERGF